MLPYIRIKWKFSNLVKLYKLVTRINLDTNRKKLTFFLLLPNLFIHNTNWLIIDWLAICTSVFQHKTNSSHSTHRFSLFLSVYYYCLLSETYLSKNKTERAKKYANKLTIKLTNQSWHKNRFSIAIVKKHRKSAVSNRIPNRRLIFAVSCIESVRSDEIEKHERYKND